MNEQSAARGKNPRVSLKVIETPRTGAVVTAPPILIASTHTIDYCCGHCGTVLMHAESDQVFNLQIKCNACGSFNSTER
jgi:DNA-directed RNA polymerase subunit RPC12/RpoP